jgi:hypothetical protein
MRSVGIRLAKARLSELARDAAQGEVTIWPAAGFVDTEKRWFMKPEVGNGKTVIQSRV